MLKHLIFCSLFFVVNGCAAIKVDQFDLEKAEVIATETRIVGNKEYIHKDISGMQPPWVNFPNLRYNNSDLENISREIVVSIFVNESGYVEYAKVVKSTGIDKLDKMVVKALKSGSRTKIFKQNGKPIRFKALQKFELRTNQ